MKIFDTDCNVIGNIPTKECPKPLGVAAGDDGLHVVSESGNQIGVYSSAPNGDFIRHLNIQPSQSNQLILGVSVLIAVVIFLSLSMGLVLRVCMYSHPVGSMWPLLVWPVVECQ